MKTTSRKHLLIVALALWAMVAASHPAAAARMILNNIDPPGQGFNDPTPRAPVGGNPGTTVGEQRRIAFQLGLDIWGSILESDVDIVVQATFAPLPLGIELPEVFIPNPGVPFPCNAIFAVLGLTGPLEMFANFPNAPLADRWYPVPLANAIAGEDLTPGPLDPGLLTTPHRDDILVMFNPVVDTPGCLAASNWYYGLDGNKGNDIDLVNMVLHEVTHGLGIVDFYNEFTGRTPGAGYHSVFGHHTLDLTTGKHWDEMTETEIKASALNCLNVVWTGDDTTSHVPSELILGTPTLEITAPASIAGKYIVATAQFGPPLASPGVSGSIVQAVDGVAPAADACQPLTNAAEVAGNIVLVDRGGCVFLQKMANIEAAGGTAALVAAVTPGCPAALLGGLGTVSIPAASLTLSDAALVKGALAQGVTGTVGLDTTRRAGADPQGRAYLWATDPVFPGGSISHLDPLTVPTQLLEPFPQPDTPRDVGLGLRLLTDMGWELVDLDDDGVGDFDDLCKDPAPEPRVVIGDCDSRVPNLNLNEGCRISNSITDCQHASANQHDFERCVKTLTKDLQRRQLITGQQRSRIDHCARESDLFDDDSDSDSDSEHNGDHP